MKGELLVGRPEVFSSIEGQPLAESNCSVHEAKKSGLGTSQSGGDIAGRYDIDMISNSVSTASQFAASLSTLG